MIGLLSGDAGNVQSTRSFVAVVGLNAVAAGLNEKCVGPRRYAVHVSGAATAVVQIKTIETTITDRGTLVFDFMMLNWRLVLD
jgi:hypothetical protein